MEQYIPKSALVAEIERKRNVCKKVVLDLRTEENKDYYQGKAESYKEALDLLDTLEVREMDIEDSIKETLAQKYIDYTFRRHNIDPESKEGQLIYYAYMHGMNQCLNQLKAQKGEKV